MTCEEKGSEYSNWPRTKTALDKQVWIMWIYRHISDIKLIRTGRTLDVSRKAQREKERKKERYTNAL